MFFSLDHFICEVLKFWVYLFNILNSHYNSYEERTHLRNMFLPFITQIAVPKSSQVEYSRKCDPFFLERECQIFILSPHSSLCDLNFLFLSKKTNSLFQQACEQRCTYIKSLLHDIASFNGVFHIYILVLLFYYSHLLLNQPVCWKFFINISYLKVLITRWPPQLNTWLSCSRGRAMRLQETQSVRFVWIKKKDFCSVYLMSLFYRRSLKSWRPSMTKLTLTEWLWSPQRWNVKSYEHTKW